MTFLGMPGAPRGVGQLRQHQPFPAAAAEALGDDQLRRNLRHATSAIRAQARGCGRRGAGLGGTAGSAAPPSRTTCWPTSTGTCVQLEEQVTARGGTVHWAGDAREASQIVTGLVRAAGETEVVKVKSMATQEIGLNDALAAAGIDVTETDLAELIVQLGHDTPSHILVPAIHRNREQIRDIFAREMPDAPRDLTDEPPRWPRPPASHLRRKFLGAKVAISGANFAVAETGTLVVVESEGNGRMCLTLPRTLITVMGIEKVAARLARPGGVPPAAAPLVHRGTDEPVHLDVDRRRSRARTSTSSCWTTAGPRPWPTPAGRAALRCIRCSACLNVCPVYERTGGHAYGSVYPGPIGAVLSPQLTGVADNPDLPFASTLCGACYDVCPVAIDIPAMLVHLRSRVVDDKRAHHRTAEAAAMRRPGLDDERLAPMESARCALAAPGGCSDGAATGSAGCPARWRHGRPPVTCRVRPGRSSATGGGRGTGNEQPGPDPAADPRRHRGYHQSAGCSAAVFARECYTAARVQPMPTTL